MQQSSGQASQKRRGRRRNTEKLEDSSASSASSVESKMKVSQLVDQVKHMIECCLVSYATKEEIVKKLEEENKIEPWLTLEVWRRLEAQNPAFFNAYDARLELERQIKMFNNLLEQQQELMKKLGRDFSSNQALNNQVNYVNNPRTCMRGIDHSRLTDSSSSKKLREDSGGSGENEEKKPRENENVGEKSIKLAEIPRSFSLSDLNELIDHLDYSLFDNK